MLRFLCYSVIGCLIFIAVSAFQNNDSPLTLLMRTMASDMKKVRLDLVAGKKIPRIGKRYNEINTAKPSSASKKGEQFSEFAAAFLVQLDRFKKSKPQTAKFEYNALAKTCVHCHETYCPGPITMLRKLQIPE